MFSKDTTMIFMLHGLGSRPCTLLPLEIYLNWCGWRNTHKISYPVDDLSLEDSTEYVKKIILNIIQPDNQIVVIGQSIGGLVGSKLHEKGIDVSLLIPIVAPLHGAYFLKQLEDNLHDAIMSRVKKPIYEELIKMHQNGVQASPPHKYHTISVNWPLTTFDGCVYVDETKFDDENHTHLRWADHRTIFIDPRLWHTINKILEM